MNHSKAILLAILMAASFSAYADRGGEGTNTNCNGRGNPNSPCAPSPADPTDPTGPNPTTVDPRAVPGTTILDGRSTNTNTNANNNTNTNTATGGIGIGLGGQGGEGGQGGAGGNATSTATGGSVNNSGNNSSTASSNSGGNTLSVVNNTPGTVAYSGSYKVKNVPDVFTPNAYPTAPCIVGLSAGGSGVGFGVSFGTGRKDDDCTRRETARRLTEQGEIQGATSLMCQDPNVYKAMPRRCDIAMRGEDDYVEVAPLSAAPAPAATEATDKSVTE